MRRLPFSMALFLWRPWPSIRNKRAAPLIVRLSNLANEFVIADAIRIERLP
jgi:hypothetical protein